MNNAVRTAAIAGVSAIVGALIGAWLDYAVREREMDIKMVEIAVGILRAEPSEGIRPAREWAVNIISYYSPEVPLSAKARDALIQNRVDPFERQETGAFGSGAFGSPFGPPPSSR